jgi:hypothetical protein
MVHKSFTAIRWFYTCNNHNWRTFNFCLLNFGDILYVIRSPISKTNTGNIHKIKRRSKRYKERRVSMIIEWERTGSSRPVSAENGWGSWWTVTRLHAHSHWRRVGAHAVPRRLKFFYYCFYRKIVNNFLGMLGPVRYFSEAWNYF